MGEPNFVNRTLHHGNNLDFLCGMNGETVHLIADDLRFTANCNYSTPVRRS